VGLRRCIEPGGCFQWATDPELFCYYHTKKRRGLYEATYDQRSLTPDQVLTDEKREIVKILRALAIDEGVIFRALARQPLTRLGQWR
jgi:hypothetical protein